MEVIILENKGQKIFGILHMPEKKKEKVPLVVLSHGWGCNHLGTWNAFFPKAARGLAKQGYAVFHFDFRGSGMSEGTFEEQTVSSEISDLKKVVDVLSKRSEIDLNRIALVGYSQGFYISYMFATKDKRPKALISWMGQVSDMSDVFSTQWINESKRKGYMLSYAGFFKVTYDPFIKDSLKYKSRDALRKVKIPVGLLYGDFDDRVPPSEGEIAKKFLKGSTDFKIMQDLTHDFTGRVGIQDDVIDITSKWLKRWL
jgi:uncharacterized protein